MLATDSCLIKIIALDCFFLTIMDRPGWTRGWEDVFWFERISLPCWCFWFSVRMSLGRGWRCLGQFSIIAEHCLSLPQITQNFHQNSTSFHCHSWEVIGISFRLPIHQNKKENLPSWLKCSSKEHLWVWPQLWASSCPTVTPAPGAGQCCPPEPSLSEQQGEWKPLPEGHEESPKSLGGYRKAFSVGKLVLKPKNWTQWGRWSDTGVL